MKPCSSAASGGRPSFCSSRMRSLIRMLASTAMPSVSRMPAMPGSVSVACSSDMMPSIRNRLTTRRGSRTSRTVRRKRP